MNPSAFKKLRAALLGFTLLLCLGVRPIAEMDFGFGNAERLRSASVLFFLRPVSLWIFLLTVLFALLLVQISFYTRYLRGIGRNAIRELSLDAFAALLLLGFIEDYDAQVYSGPFFSCLAALAVVRLAILVSGAKLCGFTRHWVLVGCVGILSLASMLPSDNSIPHQYLGLNRWRGPWEKPNIFGLLMGCGFTVAFGFLVCHANHRRDQLRARWFVTTLFLLVGVSLTGLGLLKSYSRGAWLGTLFALGYLVVMSVKFSRWVEMGKTASLFLFRRQSQIVILLIVGLTVTLILMWSFRHSQYPLVRRAFSWANINDFSWRNRIVAYEGVLQMITDKCLLGFGPNRIRASFEQHYQEFSLHDVGAYRTNACLLLSAMFGMPALACFLVYVSMIFATGPPAQTENTGSGGQEWLQAVCRACVLILLTGFLLDGGLFVLELVGPFWIFSEMGSSFSSDYESDPARHARTAPKIPISGPPG